MKTTWYFCCVQQVAFCFEDSPGMVHGHRVRSCFLSSLLFWWWSFWSCLPRDFFCDQKTLGGVGNVWNTMFYHQNEGKKGEIMAWWWPFSQPQNPPSSARNQGLEWEWPTRYPEILPKVAVNCLLHLRDYTTWMFMYKNIYIYIYLCTNKHISIYIYLFIHSFKSYIYIFTRYIDPFRKKVQHMFLNKHIWLYQYLIDGIWWSWTLPISLTLGLWRNSLCVCCADSPCVPWFTWHRFSWHFIFPGMDNPYATPGSRGNFGKSSSRWEGIC